MFNYRHSIKNINAELKKYNHMIQARGSEYILSKWVKEEGDTKHGWRTRGVYFKKIYAIEAVNKLLKRLDSLLPAPMIQISKEEFRKLYK